MMTSDKIKDTYYDYFISKYSKYIIKNSILVTAEIKNIIKLKVIIIAELKQDQKLYIECGEYIFKFLDQQDVLRMA